MSIAGALVLTTDYRDYARCRCALEQALIKRRLYFHLDILRVPCVQQNPGWMGCWDCHKKAAAMAVEKGWPLYLVLESKARPTTRFDWYNEVKAALCLQQNPQYMLVNLSILPWPFKGQPREMVAPSIYKNASAQLNGTSALLCSLAFAKHVLTRAW